MKIYDVRGIGASLTGSFSGSFKGLFTGPLDGVAATSSYVEYTNVANKPALVSGSSQVSFSGITNKPTLISGSAQIAALGYATTGSNTFINDQTITGSLAINDSATNFLIEGNIFSQTYLTSNGAIVLNPGYGGVEVVGSYKELRLNDIYANGFVSGEIRANNGVVSGSSQVLGFNVFATTGSNQFNGNQSITGSLTVSGQVIAQTLNVQQVTSSIVFSSGSNRFGNTLGNTHSFTGSVNITGSLTVNGVSASFSEYVPYTGATAEVNLGTNSMYSSMVYINGDGTGGGGVLNLKKGSTRVIGGNDAANTVSLWSDTAAFGFNDWVSANVRSAKFSLASISNNQTRTYTLPNETGTLALTSNLSSYLPLTGGTLTGALSGTSASFKVNADRNLAIKYDTNITISGQADSGGPESLRIYADTFRIYTATTAVGLTERFTISNNGLATFSGSIVGTGGVMSLQKNGSGTVGSGPYYTLYNAATTDGILFQLNASNNIDFWGLTSNSFTASPVITLTRAGAATFSSSVTAATESTITGTSANSRLLVTAAGVANTVIGFNNSGATTTGVTNNTAYLGVLQAYPLVFTTDSVERLRITSEGYLGTTVTSTTVSAGDLLGVLSFVSKDSSTYSSGGITNIRSYATTTYNTGNVSGDLRFYVSNGLQNTTGTYLFGTEAMRITSGGGVGIGTDNITGTTKLRAISIGAVQGDPLFFSDNGVYNAIGLYSSGADGYNGSVTVMIMGKNTTNSRSINAGGTINASGTDYAEYMTKAVDENISKGDIVGINLDGKLTNIFDDSISFVVKSTDPSYVGGDTWGNVDDIGKLELDATDEQKAEHEAKIEAARAKVDRIAFSGQVPCNVLGASVGDYIIPIKDEEGKISGQAVTKPTLEQYQISVGKVWKIMEDGRAWIAVKIG